MNAEIITIGTELLLGEIVDTNSAHIARTLRDIGLNLFFTTTVGDNIDRITSAISIALDRADVVLTTGGLGPTVDDMTRQAVAAATGRTLEFRQDLLDQIADRFRRLGSRMSENNRQQAYIPADAIAIENPVGTAPCFIVESERGVVISLPGVPREMKYLLDSAVLPYLRQRYNLTSIIKARVLRTAGIGESSVDETITDLMKLVNPTVGLAAHTGQTDIRITAKADDEAAADAMIADIEAQVRARVGDFIYGVDKERLEDALVAALRMHGLTIAISETGLSSKLHERLVAAGAESDILTGALHFATADDLCMAVSADCTVTAEELGLAAVEHVGGQFGADINIALVARSDGVIITVQTPERVKTRVYRFSEQDGRPGIWASTWGMAVAWSWLRRRALHG
ncbi:MAG: CinA family nicotinamide mononucleotide deamidase-related protein [Anaerolineae bacterium]|nr:CinA family nicotinamide mononucleotide deamidase-related protein [Anaerolineae bacterium]